MMWGIVTRSNVDYAELLLEEFVQGIQTFFSHRASLSIPSKKSTPCVIPYCQFTKLIIYYLGSRNNIHKRPGSLVHITGDDFLLGNLMFVPKGEKDEQYLEMVSRKPTSKEHGQKKTAPEADKPKKPTHVKKPAPAKQVKPVKENSTKPTSSKEASKGVTQSLPVVEGKGKCIATDEHIAQSILELQQPKGKIHDTPSPLDAKTGAGAEMSDIEGDTEILNVGEDKGKDVSNTMVLEERTVELDECQARSDPDFIVTVYPKFHECLKHTTEEHVYIENPPSSFGTLLSMKNLDDAFTYGDQFLYEKPTEEELDKPKLVSLPIQELIFTATTATTITTLPPLPPPQQQSTIDHGLSDHVSALEHICANFKKKNKVQDQTAQALSSRISTLENHNLYLKIDKYINDNVKEAVQNSLKVLGHKRFGELSEFEMKEIFRDQMFESGSYRSYPEHTALYDALEASMDLENKEEFIDVTAKSRKRRRNDQDPPPHPPKDSDQIKKKDVMHLSDSEDTGVDRLPKIKTRPDRLKPIPKEETSETLEPDWVIPPNDSPEPKNNWADAIAKSYQDPEENKLLQKTRDIGSFIKWYFKWIECHLLLTNKIDLINPEGNRVVPDVSKRLPLGSPPGQNSYRHYGLKVNVNTMLVQPTGSHIGGLSTRNSTSQDTVPPLIVVRADYKEYKISEADFKNLHPNDFKDLYLLRLQGNLNHLSGAGKVHLFNAVNMWIRNLVIRKCVEDLQLGIESYQKKLNLTQLNWDAYDFLFKEDYTIVHKPRAVIYRDRNDQKKMMRENEVHKFIDDTLIRILEKLDHIVKYFRLFKFNPGMENRIWSEDDKRRSKEFIEVIERRLKIRRIFRNLESFVSGRLRDVDYRLI
nr:hypothetical protein [Tanacetum cinerariifolium]